MEIRSFLENNPALITTVFPLLFKYLIVFSITVREKVKRDSPVERGVRSKFLVIFGISDSLKTVKMIITKLGWCKFSNIFCWLISIVLITSYLFSMFNKSLALANILQFPNSFVMCLTRFVYRTKP